MADGPFTIAARQLGMNETDQRAALQEYMANGGARLDPAVTAWCAAFVNASLGQSGHQGTGSNLARSFLDWGQPVDVPQEGDVAVFSRGDPNGPYGHVGFFAGYNPDGTIRVLGGNQGAAGEVSYANYSPDRLLGFRRGGVGTGGVMTGDTGTDTVMGQSAPLYSNDDAARYYQAFTSSQMTPEHEQAYRDAVASGAFPLPQGVSSLDAQPTAQVVQIDPNAVSRAYQAYVSGQMRPEDIPQFEAAVNSGTIPNMFAGQLTSDNGPIIPGAASASVGMDAVPTPTSRGSRAAEMGGEALAGAGQSLMGAFGRGPSPMGDWLASRNELSDSRGAQAVGRVLDLPMAAIQAGGALFSGGAGLVGDIADAFGMSPQAADRLSQDIAAMPEAFAGSTGALTGPVSVRSPNASLAGVPTARRLPSARTVQAGRRAAEAPATIAAGQGAGVRIMTSDVLPPSTWAGKWAQAMGERIPITGTGAARAEQAAERVRAIENTVSEFAPAGLNYENVVNNVSADLLRQNAARISQYNEMKTEVISRLSQGGQSVPMAQTISKMDSEISRLRANPTPGNVAAADILQSYRGQMEGKTLAQIEEIRSEIGSAFKGMNVAEPVRDAGSRALQGIYGPLRGDMANFIRANGERRDINRWEIGNRRLADGFVELQNTALKRAINKGDVTPETVSNLIFSNDPSTVRTLYRNLGTEGQANARAAVLLRALENSTTDGVISAARFGTNLDRASTQTGILFTGAQREAVSGLQRVLDATKRAEQASANPPTGAQAIPIIGAGLTGITGVASIGGLGVVARIYEAPTVRNILVALNRTKPGTAAERALIDRYQREVGALLEASTVEQNGPQ